MDLIRFVAGTQVLTIQLLQATKKQRIVIITQKKDQ